MAKSKKCEIGKGVKEVAKLKINRCDRSPLCPAKKICPLDAITQKRRGFLNLFADYPEIDQSKCMGCGVCVDACLRGAIYMKPIDMKNNNGNNNNNNNNNNKSNNNKSNNNKSYKKK